jgi:peptide/nickel transport system permease protein
MSVVLDHQAPALVIARVPTAAERWRKRYGLATFGAGIVLVWILIAILAPWLTPYKPDFVDVANRLQPPFGTLVGGVAAFARGRTEGAIMRINDLVLCFPPIILALAIAAALGIGALNTMIAMLVVWWPKFARLAHSLVLVQRSQEYVEAATVMGFGPGRILLRHIIPNSIGPLIVLVTLDLGNAIMTFAGLSFLGLGVVPPTPEWGSMVAEGRELVQQWWVATFPGLAILTVVLGFNFLGDGVRDWLDPKARMR